MGGSASSARGRYLSNVPEKPAVPTAGEAQRRKSTTALMQQKPRCHFGMEVERSHVCILGMLSSGKSTIRQRMVHDNGKFEPTEQEVQEIRLLILDCVIIRTKFLLARLCLDSERSPQLRPSSRVTARETAYDELIFAYDDLCSVYDGNPSLENDELEKVLDLLKSMWESDILLGFNADSENVAKVENGIEGGEMLQKFLTGKYFMHKISTVVSANYKLTLEDCLKVHVHTHEVLRFDLQIGEMPIALYDAGGDDVSRTQWSSLTKDSICCLFVIDLDSYDKMDSVEKSKTRWETSKELFWAQKKHVQNEHCCFILVLNKSDRFREKLQHLPLHSGCTHFKHVEPQIPQESNEMYWKRCEENAISYFLGDHRKSVPFEIAAASDIDSFPQILTSIYNRLRGLQSQISAPA